jgi:hypothetical protein
MSICEMTLYVRHQASPPEQLALVIRPARKGPLT